MFRFRSTAMRAALSLFVATGVIASSSNAQDYCPSWPGPTVALKQKKVTNVTIPGTNHIKGYLEKLPDDYSANPTKKYPLLVFLHGINEDGTNLCQIINQWWWCPSSLAEWDAGPAFPNAVTDPNGQAHKFILISPQIVDWDAGPNANSVINALLDYLIDKYRVDLSRVYLTGMSMGANFLQSYVSFSEANARRVAAFISVAPCSYLSDAAANTIARAKLPYWSFQCSVDNMCPGNTSKLNVELINTKTPAIPAVHTTFPMEQCNMSGLPHDVWGYAYDQRRTYSVNSRSVNAYQWLVQYSRATLLPVVLEDYTVGLRDGKVKVRWTTSAENNNARFNIERSADGVKFTQVATIPAAGHSTGKTYEWVDDRPLANLSYYRLTQTDLDGEKEYFASKRIINRAVTDRSIIIAPNPFTTELAAFINVPHTQQVTVSITDLSGRVLKTVQGKYAEGAAEINMHTADLPKGLYLLKVKGEDFVQTQKIVKQ